MCSQIERRMELVRVVSHNTHKRMVSCLQGHIGAEAEKRHVRLLKSDLCFHSQHVAFIVLSQSIHSRPTVHDLSFVFSTPHHPNNAPQSVPRLYTGNGQVKTLNTSSDSLVLSTTCSISHSDICCHLYPLCMTLCLWDSLVKTGSWALWNVSLKSKLFSSKNKLQGCHLIDVSLP